MNHSIVIQDRKVLVVLDQAIVAGWDMWPHESDCDCLGKLKAYDYIKKKESLAYVDLASRIKKSR